MNFLDEAARANQLHWDKMVVESCGFTEPWLDLTKELLEEFAESKLDPVPKTLHNIFPPAILKGAKDKHVLCLASGGGQQSAVFALLGANVTVVDLSQGQLNQDRAAARHYGYNVETFMGDMRDLTMLEDHSFDLVYQAPSMCYIPDVYPVYREVARILRHGGLYRADAGNPAVQFVDEKWDGKGYRIHLPYSITERRLDDSHIEYRHYLSETFNGLVKCGFKIDGVYESSLHLHKRTELRPGSWDHVLAHLPWNFAIMASITFPVR